MALPAPISVLYPPDHDHETLDPAPSPPIFVPLPETDIGQIYRGDTVLLPIWYALDYYDAENMGGVIDLTGGSVWFTAKIDLDEPDESPSAIRRTTGNGGAVIEVATAGAYRVWIDPASTWALDDDTMYLFDVQVTTAELRTVTVRRGIMKVLRDVTRTVA